MVTLKLSVPAAVTLQKILDFVSENDVEGLAVSDDEIQALVDEVDVSEK